MDDEFDEFDQFDEEFGDEFPQPGQLRIVPVEAVVDASDFGHAALGSAGFSSGPADFDEFEQSFADFDLESRTNNAFQAPPAATAQASVGEEDGGAKGLRLDTGSATRQAAEQEDEQEEDEEPPTPAPEPAAPAFSSASLSTSEAPVPAPAAAAPAAAAAGKGRKDGRAEEADEDGIFFDQIGTSDYTGNLSKQLQKQWKKRICVLKGTVLYVFANQQSKALITIKLPGYKLTRLPDNGFKMVRGAKSHVFAADTPAEQQTWMRLIYVAAVAPEDNFISGGVGDKKKTATRKTSQATLTLPKPAAAGKEFEVVLSRSDASQPLGMDLRVNMVEGAVVKAVAPGGAVHANGQIREGDRLIKINQHKLVGMTTEQVIKLLKTSAGDIRMTVSRG